MKLFYFIIFSVLISTSSFASQQLSPEEAGKPRQVIAWGNTAEQYASHKKETDAMRKQFAIDSKPFADRNGEIKKWASIMEGVLTNISNIYDQMQKVAGDNIKMKTLQTQLKDYASQLKEASVHFNKLVAQEKEKMGAEKARELIAGVNKMNNLEGDWVMIDK